ncbi:MAG: sulfite exporter TauE/SafE family protein [Planctomycetota bacterium]|mgnify:FL=1|nr:sulfite exporter TauE/SafE family protein [Planctomycetota bacterium]
MTLAVGLVALVYATVGHAGATGYIAAMTLFGMSAEVIRPTALMLNIVVGAITALQFGRAGYVRAHQIVPLVCGSIPAALIGGWLVPSVPFFEVVVGGVLILSAAGVWRDKVPRPHVVPKSLLGQSALGQSAMLFAVGILLGLLSGLTGVGGGVFLTPTLLFMRSAPVKQVAGTSAVFILVNSIAGLIGWISAGNTLPRVASELVVAVAIGGVIGARLGAFDLTPRTLRTCIAFVLLLAGTKLLFQALVSLGFVPIYDS